MEKRNTVVKDLMVDVFDFPHMPYWFSIRQAIGIMKKVFLGSEKCVRPVVILVFDEKYNLMGALTHIDIVKALEPRFLDAGIDLATSQEKGKGNLVWDSLCGEPSKELAEKPIGDVMVPIKVFADPDEPITKAAYLMLRNDMSVLPVLENKKKLVGIVRMIEVFDELTNVILERGK